MGKYFVQVLSFLSITTNQKYRMGLETWPVVVVLAEALSLPPRSLVVAHNYPYIILVPGVITISFDLCGHCTYILE